MRYTLDMRSTSRRNTSWRALYAALDKLAIGDDLAVELASTNHTAARTALQRYAEKHNHKAQDWRFFSESHGTRLTIHKIRKVSP